MNTLCYDYEFKTEASMQQWKDLLANIDEEIRLSYRNRISTLLILINFKKCFNITPYSLRNSDKLEHVEHRKFALYLLVNYSKETLDDIANDFNASIDELQCIKSKQNLHLEYEEKIRIFFEPLKENFLEARRTEFALSEVMLEAID